MSHSGTHDIEYDTPSDTLVYDVGRSLLAQGKRRKPDVFSHISLFRGVIAVRAWLVLGLFIFIAWRRSATRIHN